MDDEVFYYGYNYLGTDEEDEPEHRRRSLSRGNVNIAPYQPIYYAGYVSDKIEYQDIVLAARRAPGRLRQQRACAARSRTRSSRLSGPVRWAICPTGIGSGLTLRTSTTTVHRRRLPRPRGQLLRCTGGLDVTADVVRGAGEPRIRTETVDGVQSRSSAA